MNLKITFNKIEDANKYKEMFEKMYIDNTIINKTLIIFNIIAYENYTELDYIWFQYKDSKVVDIDRKYIRDIYIYV